MTETQIPRSPEVSKAIPQEAGPASPEIHVERPSLIERVNEQIPAPAVPVVPPTSIAPAAPVVHSPMHQQIEQVLSEGLLATFQSLDPEHQHQFKVAGEETATAIERLLQETKVHTRKILDLIIKWLRIIPGVNHFFLEQEAKIKADKLLTLRQPSGLL